MDLSIICYEMGIGRRGKREEREGDEEAGVGLD